MKMTEHERYVLDVIRGVLGYSRDGSLLPVMVQMIHDGSLLQVFPVNRKALASDWNIHVLRSIVPGTAWFIKGSPQHDLRVIKSPYQRGRYLVHVLFRKTCSRIVLPSGEVVPIDGPRTFFLDIDGNVAVK